jgi:hypothetical protein
LWPPGGWAAETVVTKKRKLYRVKFQERQEKQPTVVVVEQVGPSEYFGLIALERFVFFDQTKFVVLPDEDEMRKRFSRTERLHLPYHVLLSVEEFLEDDLDLKHLPFIREVPIEPSGDGTES